MNDRIVLCGASSYNKNITLMSSFLLCHRGYQDELHIMCVLFTADVGGVLQVVFDEDGSLQLRTQTEEDDILYDEIGSVLKIKQLQRERKNCLNRWKCTIVSFTGRGIRRRE